MLYEVITPVPHDGRLALVGNPDRGNVSGSQSRASKHLGRDRGLRRPDLTGIVFHPARPPDDVPQVGPGRFLIAEGRVDAGFDDTSQAGCGTSDMLGGGTGWLTTVGNVAAGQVMEVRIAVWDTGDGQWDSLVLLDNWVWNVYPASPGTW